MEISGRAAVLVLTGQSDAAQGRWPRENEVMWQRRKCMWETH